MVRFVIMSEPDIVNSDCSDNKLFFADKKTTLNVRTNGKHLIREVGEETMGQKCLVNIIEALVFFKILLKSRQYCRAYHLN